MTPRSAQRCSQTGGTTCSPYRDRWPFTANRLRGNYKETFPGMRNGEQWQKEKWISKNGCDGCTEVVPAHEMMLLREPLKQDMIGFVRISITQLSNLLIL